MTMLKKVLTIALVSFALLGTSCSNKKPTDPVVPEDDDSKISEGTIVERLEKTNRIKDIKRIAGTSKFENIYSLKFEQYIDHNNHSLGKFTQRVEFGFNGYDLPNVYVTSGYMIEDENYHYSENENEIAFLLGCNYIFVEHRYFGNSLPVTINYNDNSSWQYLTTAQAAADAHEIVRQFKRILDGKWVSSGISKGGMTTEMFAYYYPGDMDLYVPYVAPFCNSYNDMRMLKFVYEEAGNQQYGATNAAKYRNEVLQFQLKLLEYRDVLAPRYYQDSIATGKTFTSYATQDVMFDGAVLEFAIGMWQYYQSFSSMESVFAMSEGDNKVNACYNYFTSICAPGDLAINTNFHPYYVQAYQELGNYGWDFSYIRNAGGNLAITEEQATEDISWKVLLSDEQREMGHKELMNEKINNMLKTTDLQFIILYGSSDPWYSVRPEDVTDRENISIFVNTSYPHTTCISNFSTLKKKDITSKIKKILNVQ